MTSNSMVPCSTSPAMIKKYEVFVSFRGKDTRNNFTDHLFGALQRKGILTFRDDTKLKKGERILSSLMQAIEGSQIFVIVFSKNYASSTWCLRELEKILDCVRVPGKRVLPIFYDVDPSEVRKQTGDYGKAFTKHEERFKDDVEKMEEVKRWRRALTQVANFSGWDMMNKSQYDEIEKIVQEILSKLGRNFSSLPNDLVGMESPVEELEKLLLLDPVEDVRIVGIFGMGGIGKTTLVSVLYHRISHQYDACCFIDNVSKVYRDCGPTGVAKQLLHQTLNEENLQICNLHNAANLIQSRLRYVKTLIVLDNVDEVKQQEKLVLNREWLGAGSRIVIISRDMHNLKEYGVTSVYKVQLLNGADSLKLFCKKAFNCDDIVGGYKELTYDVLKYANSLPLAIKVLGSFLCGRSVSEWRSALVRLKENPNKDILDVLQISYDGLQELEKQIFLDIACFFSGYEELYVKKVLDCCGFHAEIGIRVLLDKSLIDNSHGFIEMHDLLKVLGRKIVKGNSPNEPRKWSRLWLPKDFYDMSKTTETTNNEAIVLDMSREMGILMTIEAEALSKMSNLRLLILHDVKFMGNLDCLSNKLQFLQWFKYPFSNLPSSFQPDKLVELILQHSNIKKLWKGIKYLPNLRALDLSDSKNLIKVPDFRGVPNLEWIILEGCTKLAWIHPSVGLLRKLAFLNLKNCKNLVSLPNNILGLSSLEYLNISGCPKIFSNQLLENPINEEYSMIPNIRETAMQSQSTSSSIIKRFIPFHFSYSRGSKNSGGCLLPSLPSFSCLHDLDLSFCNLSQIPDAIGSMLSLETLNLGGNKFVSLPSTINKLSKLVHLNLEHCKQLRYLPEMPTPTALPVIRGIYSFAHYGRGLIIFNCPKIVDIERCRGMAFSWLLQILQVSQESATPIGWIDIIVPGNQIPRWFNNRCVGNSISLDPSPIMLDNNWIGIACSVVFVVFDDPTSLDNDWKSSISIGFETKSYSSRGSPLYIPILLDRNLVTVKLHHLWLLYLTRGEFFSYFKIEKMLDLYGIKMHAMVDNSQGLHLEVCSCGYQWVFEEDLQNLNPTIMRRGYSNIPVDDDFVNGGSILSLEAGS
ncbi:hypothetical protein JHK87_033588 [Glycine soja]|nr:hypothetical protein JHK87_033588 [Glycine soja]